MSRKRLKFGLERILKYQSKKDSFGMRVIPYCSYHHHRGIILKPKPHCYRCDYYREYIEEIKT